MKVKRPNDINDDYNKIKRPNNMNDDSDNKGSCSLFRPANQNSLDESLQKHVPHENGKDKEGITKPPYKNHHHINQAFDIINEMRKKNLFCDVIIVTDDGIQVPAHKMVLAACSPYFYAIFTSFEQRDQEKITLQGIDYSTLQLLLDYVYSAEIHITENNVQALLSATNLFQLTDVRDACYDFLQARLHPSNCLGIRTFADQHGYFELFVRADNYVKQHFSEVVDTGEEFFTLASEQVVKLICSDDLIVPSEEKVFECVMSWIHYDPEKRLKDSALLIEHIRLPLISRKYLTQRVSKEPLFKTNPQCKDFLIEALRYHLLNDEEKSLFETSRIKPRQSRELPKILLVVGGVSVKIKIKSIEYYDFKEEKWYQVSELPIPICAAGFCVLDGQVYSIGGETSKEFLATIRTYDAAADQWSSCPKMAIKRSTSGVAVLGNCIYAIGGHDGSTGLSSAEVYDPRIREWRAIAPMSTRRSNVGIGVVKGLLYAVGGFGGESRQCLSSVECYDPEKDQWKPMPEMSARRFGVSVGVLDGILYAVGGGNGTLIHKSVEAFNPETNQWTPVSDMAYRRRSAGVVALNGLLYMVGGYDGTSSLASVEVYSPRTNTWTTLPTCMGIGRSHAGVAIIDKP